MPARSRGAPLRMWQHGLCVKWDLWIRRAGFIDSDEAQYLAQHSRDTILAWKAHQLRTVRQDKARLEILENLDYGAVFLTQDWAMKFLPRKYCESQSDWYGKGEFPGTYPLPSAAATTYWSLRDLCILSRIAPKEVQLSSQLWHTF